MSTMHWFLAFGAAALLVLGVLQAIRLLKANGTFTANFTVLFGLVTITVVASALIVAGTASELLTPAFTLFGTIAGYLAGTNVNSAGQGRGSQPNP